MLATRGSVFCFLERLINSVKFGPPKFDPEGGGIFISISPQGDVDVCDWSENCPTLLCVGGIDGRMAVMNDTFFMLSDEDQDRILQELRFEGKKVFYTRVH